MKAFLALFVAVVLTGSAMGQDLQRYKAFLAASQPTEEQKKLILCDVRIPENVNPVGLSFDIQNGLKDSLIVGAIFSVTFRDKDSDKDTTIEVYADCWDILPMSSREGRVEVYRGAEIRTLSPKIALKEIRIRKIE